MNRFTFRTILAVFCLLMPTMALAGLPGPHDPVYSGNGGTCQTCHTGSNTLGATNWESVCMTCHKSGQLTSASNGSRKIQPFLQSDYADPYAAVDARAIPYQTSHKWTGTDVVPQAGAVAPVDKAQIYPSKGVNKASLRGSVTCARCHNVHGDSGAQSQVKPYLRSPNSTDEMCLDCHRARDTKSHTLGSHPVNVSYTSAKVKSLYGTKYNSGSPLVNAANTTAQVKLVNGKIVCTTCHGVHFSDSNSRTFDNRSSAFGGLSTSTGKLLRVDAFSVMNPDGVTSTPNICTNCHVSKNHSATNVKIQCNDCHSGHVEYVKPEDKDTDGTLPNVYMLRRYVNYSGRIKLTGPNAFRRKVFFTSTSSKTTELLRTDGRGICQTCHIPSTSVAAHGTTAKVAGDCTSCHAGNGSIGSISHNTTKPSGCTDCHGDPPQVNISGAPNNNGFAPGYGRYVDEATTPHLSHTTRSIVCATCHGDKAASHATAPPTATDYHFVFNDTASKTNAKSSSATYTAVTNAAATGGSASTCNLVYCHSNGTTLNPPNATSAYFINGQGAVSWNDGTGIPGTKNSIVGTGSECITCHDNTNALTAQGSHAVHVITKTIGCASCHSATVSSNTVIISHANHANGVKNYTCTTTVCHSNGNNAAPLIAPVWGTPATGACNACHRTRTSGTVLGSGALDSVAHATHFALSVTYMPAGNAACDKCHPSSTTSTHVNGTKNVNADSASCATANCHGTGASLPAPAWTSASTTMGNDSCTKCHGTGTVTVDVNNRQVVAPSLPAGTDTGNVSSNAKTGAHQAHILNSNGLSAIGTKDTRCAACHGTLAGKLATHSDGTSAPAFEGLATTAATGATYTTSFTPGAAPTCAVYCHDPAGATGGTKRMNSANGGTGITPVWTNAGYIQNGTLKTVNNCGMCHKSPWDSGFTSSYSHGTMTTGTECIGCHGHEGNTAGIAGQQHMDGILYGNGSCDTCHGYPPVSQVEMDAITAARVGNPTYFANAKLATFNATTDYTNADTSYHTAHLLSTVTQSQSFAPCLPCHPQTSHKEGGSQVLKANIQVMTDSADTSFRFDGTRPKRYNKVATADYVINSCSNVSCHFKASPKWN